MRQTESDTIVLQVARDEAARTDAKAKMTVYFDGSCPLCTVEIGHYASQKGGDGLCFVDVSKTDAELGPGLVADAAMRRFHVRLSDGTLVSGAFAFVSIWQELPTWHWAARIARLPGVTPLLGVAYSLFLPIRPVLSKFATWLGVKPAHRTETRP